MSKRSCSVLHFRSSSSIFKSLLSLLQVDDSISEMLLWSNLLFLKDISKAIMCSSLVCISKVTES